MRGGAKNGADKTSPYPAHDFIGSEICASFEYKYVSLEWQCWFRLQVSDWMGGEFSEAWAGLSAGILGRLAGSDFGGSSVEVFVAAPWLRGCRGEVVARGMVHSVGEAGNFLYRLGVRGWLPRLYESVPDGEALLVRVLVGLQSMDVTVRAEVRRGSVGYEWSLVDDGAARENFAVQ